MASALSMAKRNVIGAKGNGFLGNGAEGRGSALPFMKQGNSEKEGCPLRSLFLLLRYHKCIAIPISHA